jgi:hypothetical protein
VLKEGAGQVNSPKRHYVHLHWSHNNYDNTQAISHGCLIAEIQCQDQGRKQLTVTEMLCKAGLKKVKPEKKYFKY